MGTLKQNGGFAILTAIVGLTVSMIVMVAMTKMFSYQNKAQQNLVIKSNFESSILQLKQYLQMGKNCANLLPANTVVKPTSSISLNQIPAVGTAIISKSKTASNAQYYQITSVTLQNITSTSIAGRLLGDLIIQGEKKNTSVGGAALYNKVPLFLHTDTATNRFLDCSTSSTDNPPSGVKFDCAAGTYVNSLSADGTPTCSAPTIETRTSDPTNPKDGQMWLRSDI